MKNWRQQIRLHFSNSILIYIYPKTKRERACRLRARTRKRGEPRDAAKRRRRRQHHHHHHHRFRRRERKRSETSSCVIISIHNIYVFSLQRFFQSSDMRCTRERREYAHKTFFADPFFSLSFSLSLSSSFFTTCKQQQQQQQQQQPISTRRRERQIGRRCGDRKMGRKRSRNSIAVERVSQ